MVTVKRKEALLMKRFFVMFLSIMALFCAAAQADTLTLPSSLTVIEEEAFYGNKSLDAVVLPEGITEIKAGAFAGSSLSSINLPTTITSIADDALPAPGSVTVTAIEGTWAYDWAVEKGYIEEEGWISSPLDDFYIEDGVIERYFGPGGDVVIPKEDTNGNPVTGIGNQSFTNCSNLTSVTIPDTVTYIQDGPYEGAFYRCVNMSKIVLPNSLTSIGDCAFVECRGLKELTFSNSITSIGMLAFCGCNSLTKITIPGSVTLFGDGVFSGCSGLTDVTINGTVVGKNAFEGCSNMKSIEFTQKEVYIDTDAFHIYRNYKDCVVYVDSLETWLSFQFANGFSNPLSNGAQLYIHNNILTEAVIPYGIDHIGQYCFYGLGTLTSVTIPDTVISIEENAFFNCSNLSHITIPNSVISIGLGAFCTCDALAYIEIPDSVTYIGGSAFASCYALTNVEIPDSVTFIGDGSFYHCNNLRSVKLSNNIVSLGVGMFEYCESLSRISIPDGVTSIGAAAFEHCTSLTDIVIPEGVTNIEDNTFYECTAMKSVKIPDSVTCIGARAFYCCGSLSGVMNLKNVSSIGMYAFYKCESLNRVVFSDSLTIITDSMLRGCQSLKSITVPASVTRIEDNAFWACSEMVYIMIPSSVTSMGEDLFLNDFNLSTVYVEPGSYAESYCKNNDIPYLYYYSSESILNGRLSLALDRKFYKEGTEIHLTATMKGGVAPYRYIYIMSIDNAPSEVSEWTGSNTYTFTASRMGSAHIGVMVQDATGAFSQSAIREVTINDTGLNIPAGAPSYNGHYYQVYDLDSIRSWQSAEYYCEAMGGYLATITSQEENDFVYNNVVKAAGYESAYFGLTDHNDLGTWRWVNGEKVDYLNWSYGEPNNEYGDEHYAMFYHEYTDGYWNDGCFGKRTGDQGRAFICEWGNYTRDADAPSVSQRFKYWGKISDSIRPVEYAKLCAICNDVTQNNSTTSAMESSFYNALSCFPEGHPLHVDSDPAKSLIGRDNIIAHQVTGGNYQMEAVQINIDQRHAIVIFAGTNPQQASDILQDVVVAGDAWYGLPSSVVKGILGAVDPDSLFKNDQPAAARRLIEQIVTGGHDALFVAGHSLGGHLAVDVTLNNDNIVECCAFDPPGRGDAAVQALTNGDRTKKITSYLHKWSFIHCIGAHVGETIVLEVEIKWEDSPLFYHNINSAFEALGGLDSIQSGYSSVVGGGGGGGGF